VINIDSSDGERVYNAMDQDGYIIVREAFTPEFCALVMRRFWRRLDEQRADSDGQIERLESLQDMMNARPNTYYKDPQCPQSFAIYNDEMLDYLLREAQPELSALLGFYLAPTYVYARIYQPGEVLERHIDREACEFSVTLTLGYEGEVWPIHIGDSGPLLLEPGDIAIYLGHQVEHWRKEYREGRWQAQAFLHYVNAQGPLREFAGDNRPGGRPMPGTEDDKP
jgi:hypothetical protein